MARQPRLWAITNAFSRARAMHREVAPDLRLEHLPSDWSARGARLDEGDVVVWDTDGVGSRDRRFMELQFMGDGFTLLFRGEAPNEPRWYVYDAKAPFQKPETLDEVLAWLD